VTGIQASDIVLQTVGLRKRYAGLTAVEALDLSVARGTVCGFLGPNGAGKTTIIRMLLGLSTPTSGTATIFGHDTRLERAAIVPLLGAMLETPSFYPQLGAIANLRVCALTSALDIHDEALRTMLARVGLSGRDASPVKTFSLGMRQRLGLAAALLSNPGLLLLDEPANGLDPQGMVDLRTLIRELAAQGCTILLSSHMLSEVEETCDEVVMLNRGRIVTQGRVSDLLAIKGHVLAVNDPTRAKILLEERLAITARQAPDGLLEISSESHTLSAIIHLLVVEGIEVHRALPQRARLEELFLELTANREPAAQARE